MNIITFRLTNTDSLVILDDNWIVDLIIAHNPNWHSASSGAYARSLIVSNAPKLAMHRVVLNNFNMAYDVDHINGNNLDNRKENLRICLHHQNLCNARKLQTRTSSKFKAVYWHAKASKWAVQTSCKGRRYSGGLFDDEIDAAKAANKLMLEVQGQFARLNIIP